MNLREAIEQQVNLGNRDPLTVADNVLRLYGEETVASWLDVRTVVFDAARQYLSMSRRGAEARASQHALPSEQASEMRRESVWVDGKGYVDADDLTADDCLVRAEHYRTLAAQNEAKARLYESWAAAIRAAGVGTLGEVPEHLRLGLEVAA